MNLPLGRGISNRSTAHASRRGKRGRFTRICAHLLVAVLEIVAASAPDPFSVQVPGSVAPGTAARRQLAVPAGTADGVDHSGSGDRVDERVLPAGCGGQSRYTRALIRLTISLKN